MVKFQDLKFCKIKRGSKKPFEKDWPKKPYTWEEIQEHIKEEDNYGVLCGYEGLIIIDADTPELKEAAEKELPKTFTILSGGEAQGKHFYYICPEVKKKIVLQVEQEDKHYGEVQSWGAQCVGPGSIHVKTGNKYKIIEQNDWEITEIDYEKLLSFIKPFSEDIKEKERKSLEELKMLQVGREKLGESDINQISMFTVLNSASFRRASNGEYYGANPWHGSSTNMNFWVNPNKNLAFCFRCNAGVNVAKAIALNKGIIHLCSEGLTKDQFLQVVKIAQEEYHLKKIEKDPIYDEIREIQKKKAEEDLMKDIERIKNIRVESGKIVKTRVVITDINPGIHLIKGYIAECPECGKAKHVFNKTKETCDDVFWEEHKEEDGAGCVDLKGKPIKCRFKELKDTGYLCLAYDPADTGSAPQFSNIFFSTDILPKDFVERTEFESSMQMNPLLIKGKLIPLTIKNNIIDWFIDVSNYKFDERKVEINKELLHYFKEVKRDKDFFRQNFCPRVFKKELQKKVLAVLMLTPEQINFPNGDIDFAVQSAIEAGDPGQSKTVLFSELMKYCKDIPHAKLISVENATNRGLIGAVVKNPTTGQFMVKLGQMTICDGGFIGLDGFGKLTQEDYAQLRGIQEEKEFQINKAGGIKKKCALRIYAISNLINPVSDYYTKHQASFDISATTSDISNKFSGADRRRYAHVIVTAQDDTDTDEINKHLQQEKADESNLIKYWNNLREFAWQITPGRIVWEEGLKSYTIDKHRELMKKYKTFEMDYGVLGKGGLKQLLAQLPAVAILHESISEELKVKVEKPHVDWLMELYEEEFFELGMDLSEDRREALTTHAQEILAVCSPDILNIFKALLVHKSLRGIEKKAGVTRMTIWRKLKKALIYKVTDFDGIPRTHHYSFIDGSGTVDHNGNVDQQDGILRPLFENNSSISDFGKIFLKVFKKSIYNKI